MSWLRNHVRHFVIPGVRALVRAREAGKTLTPADIKPFDGQVRPASICKYEEVGLLYSTLTSILAKSDPEREKLLAICRTLDGSLIVGSQTMGLSGFNVPAPDVVHSMVWSSTRRLRRFMRETSRETLVLPGRDVWAWEVAGRREGVATVFDPNVSRSVADHERALTNRIAKWDIPDWSKVLLFDTGFAGSIPRAISKAAKQDAPMRLLSANDDKNQIFPKHTGSRSKALAIEYFPKYWTRAEVRDNEAFQALADLIEFIRTGLLTAWLWHHVSPRRVAPPKEKVELKKNGKKYDKLPDIAGLQISTTQIPTIKVGGTTFAGNTTIGTGMNAFIPITGGTGATTASSFIVNGDTSSILSVNATWDNSAITTGGAIYQVDNGWQTMSTDWADDGDDWMTSGSKKKQKSLLKKYLHSDDAADAGWKLKKVKNKPYSTSLIEDFAGLGLVDKALAGKQFKKIDEVKDFAAKAGLTVKQEIDPATQKVALVCGKAKLALEAMDDLKATFGLETEEHLAEAFAHEITQQEVMKAAGKVAAQMEAAAAKALGGPVTPPTVPLALNQNTGKPLVG